MCSPLSQAATWNISYQQEALRCLTFKSLNSINNKPAVLSAKCSPIKSFILYSICGPHEAGTKGHNASAKGINNQLCIYSGKVSHHFNTYLNEQNGNEPLLLLYYSDLHLPPSICQEAERTAQQGRAEPYLHPSSGKDQGQGLLLKCGSRAQGRRVHGQRHQTGLLIARSSNSSLTQGYCCPMSGLTLSTSS